LDAIAAAGVARSVLGEMLSLLLVVVDSPPGDRLCATRRRSVRRWREVE